MRLFIRIVNSGTDEPDALGSLEWLLLDRARELVSQGAGDLAMLARLVDLDAVQDPDDVVLLLPTEQCLSIRCSVPGRTTGQMRRALPYVVEEFVAGDIDEMHIACGPVRRNAPVDVVVIERRILSRWLEALAAERVHPGFAVPDAALLSCEDSDATLLFDGTRVLVRSPDQIAAIEADALKLVLESLAASATDSGMRITAVNGRVPELLRAEVAQATPYPVEWTDSESDLTALAHLADAFPGNPPAINLLQGALAPPKRASGAWTRWRTVAGLAAVWLALVLVTDVVRGAWASHRASALASEAQTLYRSYFPNDQRLQEDLYKQMMGHLHGSASQSTFLTLLGHLASGLSASPDAQLRSITFNDGRAELGAEVAVKGFESLEALKAAWGKEGVSVDISSAEQQDQQVHARIRLRSS